MKAFNKTYYRFSVLMLVVFITSIILPASLSAATLFCDMQMHTITNSTETDSTEACCHDYGSHFSSDAAYSPKASCSYQHICSEAISSAQDDIPALPQVTKNFAVAFIYSKIFIFDDSASPQYPQPQSETVRPSKNQPLFLLNSTFLN